MPASLPKAEIAQRGAYVRLVPAADIRSGVDKVNEPEEISFAHIHAVVTENGVGH
jgi:hypothetical protein